MNVPQNLLDQLDPILLPESLRPAARKARELLWLLGGAEGHVELQRDIVAVLDRAARTVDRAERLQAAREEGVEFERSEAPTELVDMLTPLVGAGRLRLETLQSKPHQDYNVTLRWMCMLTPSALGLPGLTPPAASPPTSADPHTDTDAAPQA